MRKGHIKDDGPTKKCLEVGDGKMGLGMETMDKAFTLTGNGENLRNTLAVLE